MREVRYVAAAVCCCGFLLSQPQNTKTGWCMYTYMQHVASGNTAAVVVINLLDLYTVESATLHG